MCFQPARVSARRLVACAAIAGAASIAAAPPVAARMPHVLVVTVDTLRADHVSAYGYERPTTPHIDRLLARGVRFTDARTVEPLTAPALASMLTSLYPHAHGASRNGLRIQPGLASLPKVLRGAGYRSVAFVGNWTLRDKLCGLAEHFDQYEELLTRRRWLGMVRREATADDLTAASTDWIRRHLRERPGQPLLAWVHYVEPHAPYRTQRELLAPLGLEGRRELDAVDRYDTEIAFVDRSIGQLLGELDRLGLSDHTIVLFAADHGESLGEHDYWGHGRHLYEPTLRIPMGLVWPGRVEPGVVEAPALITDLAPTVLGLLERAAPVEFGGFDWTGVLGGAEPAPMDRVTRYEAHRGAVISRHDSDLARRAGLLAVGVIRNREKEIFRVDKQRRSLFHLGSDPAELVDLTAPKADPTEGLLSWMRTVYDGLASFAESPPEPLDPESIEQLRSLGYVD